MEEIFKQPAVIGSVIAGTVAIVLAIFSFWSNKIFSQDLDELKKILEIKKSLLDLRKKDSFDEYIRVKSNYIALVKTLNINKFKQFFLFHPKKRKRIVLMGLVFILIGLIMGISVFALGILDLSPLIASVLIGFSLGIFVELLKLLYLSSSLESKILNTRYWLKFKDGPLKGKSFHLSVNTDINFSLRADLCYPFIAIKDNSSKKLVIYRLDRSQGYVGINTGSDTDLTGFYSLEPEGYSWFTKTSTLIVKAKDLENL